MPGSGAPPPVDDAFRSLPKRYLGAPAGFDATFQVRLGDLGRTWEIRLTEHTALVRPGASRTRPDVTIATDAETWLALRAGELSGLDAFRARRLTARGELDLAVGFEGMFRLPGDRPPLLRVHDVKLRSGLEISTLTMGEGPDVLLLHGLGSAKSSFFELASALAAAGYRVHALDLPGFGGSSKPLRAPYSASWFAEAVLGAMDAQAIDRAHVVGNSMGGRVALELALRRPERVRSVVGLAPAVAFVKRGFHPLVRVLRPELSVVAPRAMPRRIVEAQFWSMFADPSRIDPAVADVAVDEFVRIYRTPGARLAFFSAARHLYLDAPFGPNGFYRRLSALRPPALFVWGTHDQLIPAAFKRHVAEWLPSAEQLVLDDCGHAPQVERAEQAAGLVRRFLARAEMTGPRDERHLRVAA